ncbi:SGNH/GDSL hydrolase family protein [Mesorhizobium sp. M0074]|uniref:SGNH/GDSL hydrolase family protein n=1 Tax=Mesorhizobium sp. M0074 TaxID=2956869 RepID=UPI00333C756B
MAETGIYSTDLPLVAALDEVTGNATIDGIRRSARQSMTDHAEQIMADGPIAEALAAEAAARAIADTALDGRVTAVEDTVGGLPGEMDALSDRVDAVEALALSGVKAPKQSVRLLVTTATDPATMTAGSTLDGLTLAANDRVARATAAGATADGVYVVQASGAAIRSTDMDAETDLVGARFDVDAGTHAAETWAVSTAAPITVGTTVLTLIKTSSANATTAEVQAARGTSPNLGARLDLLDSSSGVASTLAQIEGLSIATAKLTEAAGSVSPNVFRSFSLLNATTYEHVVVAKAAERGALQLTVNGPVSVTGDFDLVNGTYFATGVQLVSAAMTAIGGGWYECKIAFLTPAAGSGNVQTRISQGVVFPYTGDGTSGVYVRSIVLRLPNTTANLLPSSDPTNAIFTKTNVTAANTTTAESRVLPPLQAQVDSIAALTSGRLSADKIIEQSGSGSPAVYRSNASWAVGQTFVFETIAKKAERTRLNIFSQAPTNVDCTFDLLNGTCSGSGSALNTVTITPLGNGWYRCRITGTATGTGSNNFQHRVYPAAGGHPYVGDGVSGLYLQQSYLSTSGSENRYAISTDFSSTYWTKAAGVTVSPNSGLYLGLLSDPANIGGSSAYDDGRAALVGKKWTALGTSITVQAQYTAPLASSTGMVLTNAGVSGAAIGVSTTAYPSTGIYDAIATIPTDSEIVTLEAGINDFWAQEVILGALNDTTTATFYGALWAAVVAIRARAPSAKIIFFTPYSGGSAHASARIMRANSHGNTLDQFQKAVRDVANLTGYPCIDIAGKSGIGYFTGLLYMSDNLHINATGGTRYANCALDDLRKLSRAGFFGT